MTVKEFITKLLDYRLDSQIFIEVDGETYSFYEEKLKIDEDGDLVIKAY